MEVIHRFVESINFYFNGVCEYDIIFNYEKVHYILDELIIGGELFETNKRNAPTVVDRLDKMEEEEPQGY
ncbi:hypothetical protein MXB_992 [Myxobolus squamalis]|nr:hypothetical protein MXB_992 [Myxobolus squamalis]